MVRGMESFIRRFRDYADCYTIIGGIVYGLCYFFTDD